MWHAWGRGEVFTGFWLGGPKVRDYWEGHRLRMSEKGVLRRILRFRRDEVTGDRRRLHNEEIHNLYSSPHIIRVVKPRRVRLARHVACLNNEFLSVNLKVRDHLGDILYTRKY
jgi:hypothetical protein